uniref:SMK-1 domain-containing protein n=1 Tax=Parastrongyloides trichosuri TaxID=131310 RepID=A0A0N4Z597_PARTI
MSEGESTLNKEEMVKVTEKEDGSIKMATDTKNNEEVIMNGDERSLESKDASKESENTVVDQSEDKKTTDGKECNGSRSNTNEVVSKVEDSLLDEDGIDPLCPDYIPYLEIMEIEKNSHTRVKLYVLCEQKIWTDKGTGHVAILSHPGEEDISYVVVRLETDDKNVLQRRILKDTNYEKQQDTLVVWAEGENVNLALSFQEKDGCEQTWANIVKAQGRNPAELEAELRALDSRDNNSSLNSSGVAASSIAGDDIELPACNLGNLCHFENLLSNSLGTPVQRERMAIAIEESSYIRQLCGIFQLAENMEHSDKLAIFGKIVKGLFMLNRRPIVVEMLDSQYVKDIVGMFEYDTLQGEQKNHRDFLWKKSNFKEIIPINNEEVKRLIRRSYILQYILDVCMPPPSMFEDNLTFQATKYQLFIRVKIVCSLIDDKTLMKELFTLLQDPNVEENKRLELMNFLKEFCSLARTLPDYMAQSPAGCDFPPKGKEQFFSTLVEYNFFNIIPVCLKSTISATRSITIELLNYFLENNPKLVRDFIYKDIEEKLQKNDKDGMIINMIVSHIFTDRDAELYNANQCLSVIRALIECSLQSHPLVGGFFNHCLPVLCQPLSDNLMDGKIVKESYYIANKMTLIINFFTFCIEQHGPTVIRLNPAISTIIINAGYYMSSRYHWLSLTALRLFKKLITPKHLTYQTIIKKNNILDLIVKTFEENGPRYNLLNSAILDFYQYIADEKMNDLITITVERHFDAFKNIVYVKTFRKILAAYSDLMNSRTPSNCSTDSSGTISMTRNIMNAQWKKEQDVESDEQYFDKDDDDLDDSENDEIDTSEEKDSKILDSQELVPKICGKEAIIENISPVFCGGHVEPLKGHGITFKFERKVNEENENSIADDGTPNYKISLVKYDDSDEDDYDGPINELSKRDLKNSKDKGVVKKRDNEYDDDKPNSPVTLASIEPYSIYFKIGNNLQGTTDDETPSSTVNLPSNSETTTSNEDGLEQDETCNENAVVNENLGKISPDVSNSLSSDTHKKRRSDTREDFLASINENDITHSPDILLEEVDEYTPPMKKRRHSEDGVGNNQSEAASNNAPTSHAESPTATV